MGIDDSAAEHLDVAVAQAAWIATFGGAIRGLTHALGNRLHSLEMILGSLAPGEAVTAVATAALDVESAGCAELTRLYRMMPLATDATPEACRVGDILPDAVTLFRHHIDGRDARCAIEVIGEPPAVLVAPQALTQAMLIVLCGAVADANDGSSPTVTIKVTGEGDSVQIDVVVAGMRGSVAADSALIAARWLLQSAHARVMHADTGSGTAVRIVLPSLAAARRRERGSA